MKIAKATDFEEAIKRIAQHTQQNDHCESVMLGMQLLLNMDDEVKEIENIMRKHAQLGHMSVDLEAQRRVVYDKMMAHAKAQLTQDQFIKFYMVF